MTQRIVNSLMPELIKTLTPLLQNKVNMAESAGEGPTLQLLFTEGWEAQKKVETGSLSAEEKKVLIKTIKLL